MVEERPLGTRQTGGGGKGKSRQEKDLTLDHSWWQETNYEILPVSSSQSPLDSESPAIDQHEFIAQTYKYSLPDLFHCIYVCLSVHKYMSA